VFAPHQDDESLGCGGLIALKQSIEAPIKVIFLTNGDVHQVSDRPSELSQLRQQEALSALQRLGLSAVQIDFLNFPDGQLTTLDTPQHERLIQAILGHLQTYPEADVFVPHYQDCHPDHEATCQVVQQAIARLKSMNQSRYHLWQYPIWLFWKVSFIQLWRQAGRHWQYLPIAPVLSQKQQAIQSHHSQVVTLPPGFLRRFGRPYELFYRVSS
jgi:LmbE family N-acetylglucosaminyl deacetylase